MTDTHIRSTEAYKRDVSAEGGDLFHTLARLWPYIWPVHRYDLKMRVVGAMVLLLAAKLATVAVPFTFKWATDALTHQGTTPSEHALGWLMAAPVLLTIGYGGMRVLMAVITQVRDGRSPRWRCTRCAASPS